MDDLKFISSMHWKKIPLSKFIARLHRTTTDIKIRHNIVEEENWQMRKKVDKQAKIELLAGGKHCIEGGSFCTSSL